MSGNSSYIGYDFQPEGSWFNHDRPYYKCHYKSEELFIDEGVIGGIINVSNQFPCDYEIPDNKLKIVKLPNGKIEVLREVHPSFNLGIVGPTIEEQEQELIREIQEKEEQKRIKRQEKIQQKIRRNQLKNRKLTKAFSLKDKRSKKYKILIGYYTVLSDLFCKEADTRKMKLTGLKSCHNCGEDTDTLYYNENVGQICAYCRALNILDISNALIKTIDDLLINIDGKRELDKFKYRMAELIKFRLRLLLDTESSVQNEINFLSFNPIKEEEFYIGFSNVLGSRCCSECHCRNSVYRKIKDSPICFPCFDRISNIEKNKGRKWLK